jgi:hypothetical protein
MLKSAESVMPPTLLPPETPAPLRSVQPSLLDLRFTGDPWVVDQRDGTVTVRLDNYRLARFYASPIDVPSLNHLLLQLRQCQRRRRVDRPYRVCAREIVARKARAVAAAESQ